MKLSVTLPEEDVELLDEYARTSGLQSRSAALQRAVRLLRHANLEQDYAAAWLDGGRGRARSATGSQMRRGEVRLVDLDPAHGSEADKRRPAIVVSNDHANATAAALGRAVATVVAITSNVMRVFPFQTLCYRPR